MISSSTVRFLSVRSTRKVYITYTKWCVNRMMQGEETTTIYLDLLQVGLTSFLDSGASFWGCEVASRESDKVGRSLQVGFFGKSAIRRVQVQFSETVYLLTSWIRILKQLPTLKTQNQAKAESRCTTEKAQVCFWIDVYTTENVTKILFWFMYRKNYQGYPQANECPCSVSAARNIP